MEVASNVSATATAGGLSTLRIYVRDHKGRKTGRFVSCFQKARFSLSQLKFVLFGFQNIVESASYFSPPSAGCPFAYLRERCMCETTVRIHTPFHIPSCLFFTRYYVIFNRPSAIGFSSSGRRVSVYPSYTTSTTGPTTSLTTPSTSLWNSCLLA